MLKTISDGRIRLVYHPGQMRAWDSDRRFTFVIAGTQSGKTVFGPWWMLREIQRRGAGDYLAVTATYDLFKLKMLPEMINVFCNIVGGWEYRGSERILISSDKLTRIILRSANTPEGLESATAKAAWLDECGQDTFRVDAWEAIQRRLSLHEGRVLGTTTPYNLGWLKTEIYDRWTAGHSDINVINFKSVENPVFPLSEYERAKAVLPDWKFQMFYNGVFTRPAGLIYSDFNNGIHKIKPFDIPPEWPRYAGIDFGAIHTAVVWIAENPAAKTYYVYREYLDGNKTSAEHVRDLKQLSDGENMVLWAGGAKSESQQRWDWSASGLYVREPVVPDVEAGIDRVVSLIKTKRLFVFDNCRGILDELGTYSRDVDEYGHPTERIKDKETFHRLDALRYAVQHLDQPAGVRLLDFV